jgi:uncharacterized delta-60 repeat protein
LKAGRPASALVLGLVFFAMACGSAVAAPGDLDRFFGQEGIASLDDLANGQVTPVDMAVGPDNSIYILSTKLGCYCPTSSRDLLVSRRDPHGGRDETFGTGGTSTALGSPTGALGLGGSLAVGTDGKVVVGSTEKGDIVLARLNPDGSLDSSFGIGGIARVTVGGRMSGVRVAVQGDGEVVVGADMNFGYGEGSVAVARLTQLGTLDPAFNGGRPVVTSLGYGLGGLGLAGNSGVVVAGPHCCISRGSTVHIARLNAGGKFDTRFGHRGHRFVDDVVRGAEVDAVLALPGGKIDVVGSGRSDAFALRLLPGGRLDPAFGEHGIAYMRNSNLSVSSAAVDADGRLVIAGTTPKGREEGRSTVLRRLPNGRPDRSFGGGSFVRLRTVEPSSPSTIGLQSGDRVVALVETGSCERYCSPFRYMLVRYRGGSGGARCNGRRATIIGTRSGETLVGTRHRDVIVALSGNDVVRGRGGNDLVCGGRGDDRLSGGSGRDRLIGGPGRDEIQQ